MSLLWMAMVDRRAASGGGAVMAVVDLVDDGGSAGGWAESGTGRCGRARSARLSSVARRRTAPAADYMLWRRSLPDGKRYGDLAGD